jgi:hypothetical protein
LKIATTASFGNTVRLPPLPDIYRRVTLGVDIMILDRRTQRIVDIIHDILRP